MRRILFGAVIAAATAMTALAEPELEVSFEINATTNYIFRGESQTDDRPALQGGIEGGIAGFYLGAWASNVRIDDDRAELDLSAGYRNAFRDLEYDLGYTRYLYDDSGDCCGEAYLALDHALDHALGEAGGIGASYYYDFDARTSWFDARARVEVGDLFVLGGTIGTDFDTLELGDGSKVAWDLGATRALTEIVGIDLRYHDSNYDPGRLVLSLAAEF